MTALNPLESLPSDSIAYHSGGFPDAPDAITEIPLSRTGSSIGLKWEPSQNDGGSVVLVYSLVVVVPNT